MPLDFGFRKAISSMGWEQKLLLLGAICTIITFISFMPSFYASIDEHGYLQNAVLFSQGKLGESDPAFAPRGAFNGLEYISNRFIGKSVSMIPFLFLGLTGVMLSGLIIHLLNFFIIIKILG